MDELVEELMEEVGKREVVVSWLLFTAGRAVVSWGGLAAVRASVLRGAILIIMGLVDGRFAGGMNAVLCAGGPVTVQKYYLLW